MKICHVFGYYDPELQGNDAEPAALLEKFPLVRELPAELARLGHSVTVLHHYFRDAAIEQSGISYEFIKPSAASRSVGNVLSRFYRQAPYPYFQLSGGIQKRLKEIEPDIIHYFGLTILPNLWLISRRAVQNKIPLVVHYHGGSPVNQWPARRLERKILPRLSRVLFTSGEQAAAWIDAGLAPDKVRRVMETSTAFHYRDRRQARRESGLSGNPVFVSAGRLHPVKDPLTMLRGFARIAEEWSEARLYLFYRSEELLPQMKKIIANDPRLKERVKLCGEAAHSEMESVLNSADFYLQASRREFSGYAVLEAMACGTIPVVTDIPSFREMTEGGRFGLLFPPGDDARLASRVLQFGRKNISTFPRKIRKKFDATLSFPVLAKRIEEIYRELLPGDE